MKEANRRNLNDEFLRADERYYDLSPLADPTTEATGVTVRAYFREIERHLLGHIGEADVVVGCVAWLTSQQVLRALSQKKGVSIIVQKEDFLRPDYGASDGEDWRRHLRQLYGCLPATLSRWDEALAGTALHNMSSAEWGAPIDPVRCVGDVCADRGRPWPRMHNKFLVFCRADGDLLWGERDPYAVWTGSLNMSHNACASLENAVYMEDHGLARAYFEEWAQIAALSESLDWSSKFVAPDWRLGS